MTMRLFAGASTLILALAATPAMAQTEGAAPAVDESAADASGDIVVTANKRSERLQDVAASVTAFDDQKLEAMAIISPRDFSAIAPTLNFQAADEARLFNFSIRGIGTESFSVGVEPSVATIIDGVIYTRPGAAFDGLGDIERVEVLNGPQGTLQGKNASAGVVNIITKRPNRDAFEGKVELGIAEHNDYSIQATLSGPISDKLAFRAFGYYKSRDGVVINVADNKPVNNAEGYGFRGKLEFEPAEGVNFLLTGDITYNKADCCAEPLRVAAASGNVTSVFTGTPIGPENRFVNLNTKQEGSQKNRGVSLEGNFEIGDLTLTSVTAYREFRDFAIRDRDGTNAPFTGVTAQQLFNATVPGITAADALTRLDALLINPLSFSCRNGICGESNSLEANNTFTQELRLTSLGGQTIDYIVGAYYYSGKVERDLTIAGVRSNIAGNVIFPTPTTVTVARDTAYVLADMVTEVRTTNRAIFGNIDFRPFDGFTFSAGGRFLSETLRWNHRKVTGPNGDHIGTPAGINPAGQVAVGANPGTPMFDFYRKYKDSELIGKLVAKYEITPDIMIYGSWARGYKGQAVDADLFLTAAGFAESPVAPEKSRSWEAGIKSQFWDRRITVNLTAYDTKFTGYQTTSSGTDGSGAPVLRSAGELLTKGIEGDISIRPIDGLTLAGNFLFANNEFGDLFVSPTVNLRGGLPLNAPETKWGLSGQYGFDVGGFGVDVGMNYNWTSKTLFTNLADANNPNSVWLRPSFGIANLTLSVTSPDERYKVGLYVKNLFDKFYVDGLRRISGSVGGAGAVAQSLPRDYSRYIGGTVSVRF